MVRVFLLDAGFDQQARLVTGLLVGSSYLYGAAGNLWATRGRHPAGRSTRLPWSLLVMALGSPASSDQRRTHRTFSTSLPFRWRAALILSASAACARSKSVTTGARTAPA